VPNRFLPKHFNGTTLNQNKAFLYGRTHAQRERYLGAEGNATIYYEVYCNVAEDGNKSLLPNGLNAKYSDDPRWFINTQQQTAYDGKVNTISQKATTDIDISNITNATPTKAQLNYNETKGYPYKATMEINSSNWLLYNKYNENANKNRFEVEFIKSNSSWGGIKETNSTTHRDAAEQTNRRLMW